MILQHIRHILSLLFVLLAFRERDTPSSCFQKRAAAQKASNWRSISISFLFVFTFAFITYIHTIWSLFGRTRSSVYFRSVWLVFAPKRLKIQTNEVEEQKWSSLCLLCYHSYSYSCPFSNRSSTFETSNFHKTETNHVCSFSGDLSTFDIKLYIVI